MKANLFAALMFVTGLALGQDTGITDAQIEALRDLCDFKRESLEGHEVAPEETVPAQCQMRPPGEKIEWITIHATLSNPREPAADMGEEKALLDRMESGSKRKDDSHDELNKYGSIPYHILIGPSGTVYQGRDFRMRAGSNTVYAAPEVWTGKKAHSTEGMLRFPPEGEAPGRIEGHLTIALIGTFQSKEKTHEAYPSIPLERITEYPPSEAAEAALVRVVAGALRANGLGAERVLVHREVASSTCPGDFAYERIRGAEKHPGGKGPLMERIIAAWEEMRAKNGSAGE